MARRPRRTAERGEGAHAEERRTRAAAAGIALGADRQGVSIRDRRRERDARGPLPWTLAAPRLPLHVRARLQGGLRDLLDDCRRVQRVRRAPAPTAPLKLSCLKPYTSGVSSALDARAWRNGRRSGLEGNLSARWETGDAELPKFGEPCHMAIPSQARPEPSSREGVETRRAAPNPGSAGHGEGIVQTANPASEPGRRKP